MRRSLYAAAALLQGANALLATPPRRRQTRLRNLNDHIDVLQGQFEASPVDGLPDWVQTTLEQQGLNVLTFDEGKMTAFVTLDPLVKEQRAQLQAKYDRVKKAQLLIGSAI